MSYDFFASVFKCDRPDCYVQMLRAHATACAGGAFQGAHPEHRNLFHAPVGRQVPYDAAMQARRGLLTELGLELPVLPRQGLPRCALTLQFKFTLAKNYLSRDDAEFYPTPNPIRKERVFRVPMVAGSAWKGALRAAAVENLVTGQRNSRTMAEDRLALITIFGDEKEPNPALPNDSVKNYLDEKFRDLQDDTGNALDLFDAGVEERDRETDGPHNQRAALHCLPTYFFRVNLDVINPRHRTRRAGIMPILYETVPAGTTGVFALLYMPLKCVQANDDVIRVHHHRHWRLIGEAIRTMLLDSGFGAKTSNGCGRVIDAIADSRFDSQLLPGPVAVRHVSEIPQLRELFGGPVR